MKVCITCPSIKEESGRKYANAIKAVFPSGHKNSYTTKQMNDFNDARYNQEKTYVEDHDLPYLEGSTEDEFRSEFYGFIKDFINNGEIDEKDKPSIREFFMDYIERLALNGVKEVKNEKNLNSAVAHLDRHPLYHYNKQK